MAPSAIQINSVSPRAPNKGTESIGKAFPYLSPQDAQVVPHILASFRCFIANLCQQFNGGHPESTMGMAAIGVALWKYVMKCSPRDPNYFNRDRLVLSNGKSHMSISIHVPSSHWLRNMTLDQLKSYHSSQTDSICLGHPEIEIDGIEVTTGPLGQGVANAVGLAMASKHLGAVYNRPDSGLELVSNTTWCMIGDACLQEGVALEAIQLARHWRLDNLLIIYDINQITCDGSVDLTNSEDVNAKMRACGWHVIEVADGNHDVERIVQALLDARAADKPAFVNIRTVIGIGSAVAGDAKAHGAALGVEDVAKIKTAYGFDSQQHMMLDKRVYDFFEDRKHAGDKLEADWNSSLARYAEEYPEFHAELQRRIKGDLVERDRLHLIPAKDQLPTSLTATRKPSGLMCNPMAAHLPEFMVGTADLSPSVNMIWKDKVDFQHPDLRTACGINGNYTGRYIHWGVREHAMASISNGLSAFNKGTIIPVTSSFFMFYLYAAPGIRMGALQQFQQIHIATHDSIGMGEDGPTHQPIELAALYRSMPRLQYIRPCDSEETAGACIAALRAKNGPSIISLSRHNLDQYPQYSSRDGVCRGAYVFIEDLEADVTLIGVGAEMAFAVNARTLLADQGIKARIISFPCQRLFEQQSSDYQMSVLLPEGARSAPRVVIEAYAVNGWERYADAGWSMCSFVHSLPGKAVCEDFGFNAERIADGVAGYVREIKERGDDGFRGLFRDLNSAV